MIRPLTFLTSGRISFISSSVFLRLARSFFLSCSVVLPPLAFVLLPPCPSRKPQPEDEDEDDEDEDDEDEDEDEEEDEEEEKGGRVVDEDGVAPICLLALRLGITTGGNIWSACPMAASDAIFSSVSVTCTKPANPSVLCCVMLYWCWCWRCVVG